MTANDRSIAKCMPGAFQAVRMFDIPWKDIVAAHDHCIQHESAYVWRANKGIEAATYWVIDPKAYGNNDIPLLVRTTRDEFNTDLWTLIISSYVGMNAGVEVDDNVYICTSEEGAMGAEGPWLEVWVNDNDRENTGLVKI